MNLSPASSKPLRAVRFDFGASRSRQRCIALRPARRWVGAALALAAVPWFVGVGAAQLVIFNTSSINGAPSTFNASVYDSGLYPMPVLSRVGLTAATSSGSFASSNNLFTQNTPDFSQKYVTFTLSPSSGAVLYATGITFSVGGAQTPSRPESGGVTPAVSGASNLYAIAYSTNGFSTFSSSTGGVTQGDTAQSYDFTDLITNDPVEVRVQNYGTTSASGDTPSAGGIFRFGSSSTPIQVSGSVYNQSGNIALAASATTEVRVSTTLTLSGSISGNFSTINKTGAGTLTLTGANTLGSTGAASLNVSVGTLLVNNVTGQGSASGPGGAAVASGATLGGGGYVAGTVNVANGGTLAPGAAAGSVGTLSMGTNLVLNNTSNLIFDLSGDGVGDRVAVAGALTLDGKLTINGVSGFGAGQYLLFSYASGSLTNNTLDVVNAPTGYNYAIDTTGNPGYVLLDVTPVPEPATLLGGALMVGAVGWNRRRQVRAAWEVLARRLV